MQRRKRERQILNRGGRREDKQYKKDERRGRGRGAASKKRKQKR